jgi:hypothetical protein
MYLALQPHLSLTELGSCPEACTRVAMKGGTQRATIVDQYYHIDIRAEG